MKQEKIQKVLKVLNCVCMVAFVFFIVCGIIMLVASGYFSTLPHMKPYSNQPSVDTIVNFQGTDVTWKVMCFELFVFSIHVILSSLVCYGCHSICKCILKGQTPFQQQIVRKIRWMSLVLLCNDLFIMEQGSFFSMEIPLDALTVFAISFIFEYGCELQKEVDELL